MHSATIDLGKFLVSDSRVLTGRHFGKSVREESRIDELVNENESVDVIIPESIYVIGPSFFEELFLNVIRRLGRTQFQQKIHFINKGEYPHQQAVDEAVERVLRKGTALD
jgi:restriction endonuclease Mrr